jgi:hypothetical protein
MHDVGRNQKSLWVYVKCKLSCKISLKGEHMSVWILFRKCGKTRRESKVYLVHILPQDLYWNHGLLLHSSHIWMKRNKGFLEILSRRLRFTITKAAPGWWDSSPNCIILYHLLAENFTQLIVQPTKISMQASNTTTTSQQSLSPSSLRPKHTCSGSMGTLVLEILTLRRGRRHPCRLTCPRRTCHYTAQIAVKHRHWRVVCLITIWRWLAVWRRY